MATDAGDEHWTLEHGMLVRRFGTGPELLWIHGLGEWSLSFDPVARDPALAGFTHVLPDLPGYGRSPRAAPGDLASLADHLAAWLGPRRPIAIGHSMGGVLTTLLAERNALGAAINVDGNTTHGDCTFSAKIAAYSLPDFIARGFTAIRDEIYTFGLTDRAFRGYHAGFTAMSPITCYHHSLDLLALSKSDTLAPRLAAVRCPTFFIAAVPGGVCELTRAALDRHRIPWTAVDRSGHWPFVDRPVEFTTAVAGFLRSLSDTPPRSG